MSTQAAQTPMVDQLVIYSIPLMFLTRNNNLLASIYLRLLSLSHARVRVLPFSVLSFSLSLSHMHSPSKQAYQLIWLCGHSGQSE